MDFDVIEEKLPNDDVSGVVVDWAVDTHNSLLQQSREDVYDLRCRWWGESYVVESYGGVNHRFSIKGRVYPAILPLENSKVNGRVLLGITDHERFILDEFEDVEYEKSTVDVTLVDSCEMLKADTYVWSDKNDPNLYGEWDFEQWKKVHMDDFLKMTMGFMEELDLPESNSRVTTYETYYKKEDDNKPSLSS
ncbi:hypothetical protein ACFE04_009710 [Oxalis oulophora]